MNRISAKPFLKWAGGKGQMLDQLAACSPKDLLNGKITKYVEPFVGGGAVFFRLISKYNFEEIILNDFNPELILAYTVIRDNVDELIDKLTIMELDYLSKSDKEREKTFYEVRNNFNSEKNSINYDNADEKWISHAANLIFLNKTCFNGLYRLNSKGGYNVPFGKYTNPTICDTKNLEKVHEALQSVILVHGDFEALSNYIDKNTFVYMDPPYRPLTASSSFNSYSKSPFNDDSQRRLAKWYKFLHDEKHAHLMLSNSDPTNVDENDTFFDDLYSNFTITRLSASRMINSKSSGRGSIREILVTNEVPVIRQICVSECL